MQLDQQLIVTRRVQRGLSQADLAFVTGLSRSFICQLESGARGASPESIVKIASALAVDPYELVDPSAGAGNAVSCIA